MKTLKKVSMLCATLILFSGCVGNKLNLIVSFNTVDELKTADNVIFQGRSIGKVNNISFTEKGKYFVKISIDSDFKNAATTDSLFYISDDPVEADQKAVEIKLSRKGGNVLADGSKVQGIDPPSGSIGDLKKNMQNEMDKFKETLEKGVDEFKKDIDKLAEDLGKVPESEEFKAFSEKMARLAEEMKKSGGEIREKIQNDILPKLWSELDKLREKLNDLGREDEMKQLDKKAETLKSI